MASKDRLNELKSRNHNHTSEITIHDGKASKQIQQTAENVEKIDNLIEHIRSNTTKANNILKDNVFKIPTVLSNELNRLFKENEQLSYKINKFLTELKNEVNSAKTNLAQNRIKRVQCDRLTFDFKSALSESTACLEYHQQERKKIYERSIRAACTDNANIEEQIQLLDDDQTQVFIDDYFSKSAEAKRQLEDIHERHAALLKIEKHLTDVRDLFFKTAVLIEQQQESIERVAYYAGTATDYVETGARDISQSAKKKQRLIKCKFILFAILVVVALLLAIGLFVH